LLGDSAITLKAGVNRLRPVVARGSTLTGVVRDAKGKSVAGANVSVFFADAMQPKVSEALKEALRMAGAVTDSQGQFKLEGLLPGEYEVVAKSLTSGEGTAQGSAPGALELRLEPAFVLEGLVVDAAGAPVEKAYVSFQRKGVTNMTYGALTEADGRFRYALKSPGTFEVTAARTYGGPPTKPQLAELPGAPLKLVVGEALSVRGTVVDASGKPRAGVVVQAISMTFPQLSMAQFLPQPVDPAPFVDSAKQMGMYAEALSAADGGFSLPLSGDAMVFTEPGAEFAEPVKGNPTTPVRLVLAAHARATGRVLDPSGRPLSTFSINGKQFTSAEGRFELPLPARGTASLRFDAAPSPYETRAVEVPPTATEVPLGDIRLKRGFTVRGTVLAAEGRKPIASSPYLDAKSEGGQFDSSGIQPDGSFLLRRVPEGKLVLAASHASYAPAGVTVEVKKGLPEQVLMLVKYASLELTVLERGEPVAGANVEALGAETPAQPVNRRSHTTSSDGTVKLTQLSPGAWTLKVGRPARATRTVKLEPGEQAKLEVSLP
jgi:protocatechuate 3,4-dioxygenase beta subunit